MQSSEKNKHTRRGFLTRIVAALSVPLLLPKGAQAATVKAPVASFDLSFLEGAVTLMRRNAWTSDSPRRWLLREGGVYDRITIHHQGGRPSVSRVQNAVVSEIDAIYGGHRRLRYGDIAYHFIVDYSGRVWEGRSLAYQGAHVIKENDRNLGVLLLGNFEEQSPSQESLDSILSLVQRLRVRFGVKKHRVYGHRDLGSSVCPGKHLYPHVVALREGGEEHDS